jgi:hypothetical protein
MQVFPGEEPKKRSYTQMISDALERGEDLTAVEAQIQAEAQTEEQEAPIQPEMPAEDMAATRQAEEKSLEGQIRAKEDEMGGSRAGLERGLIGAAQTIGASSIARQGGDASAFNKGMQNASELIQDPLKAAEQRRAFLKERLGRTDMPYRAKTDDLVLKQRERGERIGSATEKDKIAQEQMDTGLKSADLTMKSNAAQLSNKRVDATSDLSQAARAREATRLKRTAMQIGKTDPGTAKSLLQMASNLETNQNLSEQELGLLDEMKFTPPEDQSLEWFKARTARANMERPRVGEEKAKMLSDKQTAEITSIENAIAEAAQIAEIKGEIDTGPISNAQSWLAQKAGIDDPQKSAFKARVGEQLAQYIRGISGAAVSIAEREALLQNIPKLSDNDATFSAKLDTLRQRLDRVRGKVVENITKQGKDTSEFQQGSSAQTSTPPVVTDPNDL